MARYVEVELAFGNLAGIDARAQNALAFVARPGQDLSERPHDYTAAADPCRLGGRLRPRKLARRDHEAAALESDVPHGDGPRFPVVYSRRAVESDALAVHGGPQERHVVLP